MSAKARRVLYHFQVTELPTDGPLTLGKWLAWRQAEDQRLERMREAAREQLAQGQAAQFERDVDGLTQH